MLAGVSAADLALLIRGSEAGGSQSEGAPALSVAEWRRATAGHGFGEGGEVGRWLLMWPKQCSSIHSLNYAPVVVGCATAGHGLGEGGGVGRWLLMWPKQCSSMH
eukprot:1161657-Pelagomonas_calceolata.AAC.3